MDRECVTVYVLGAIFVAVSIPMALSGYAINPFQVFGLGFAWMGILSLARDWDI